MNRLAIRTTLTAQISKAPTAMPAIFRIIGAGNERTAAAKYQTGSTASHPRRTFTENRADLITVPVV
jgi:hypothetical protein